jgi:hypothetical protein
VLSLRRYVAPYRRVQRQARHKTNPGPQRPLSEFGETRSMKIKTCSRYSYQCSRYVYQSGDFPPPSPFHWSLCVSVMQFWARSLVAMCTPYSLPRGVFIQLSLCGGSSEKSPTATSEHIGCSVSTNGSHSHHLKNPGDPGTSKTPRGRGNHPVFGKFLALHGASPVGRETLYKTIN